MRYTKRTLVVSRSRVAEAERRVAVQRQVVKQLKAAGHPTDDAKALLLLMEQGLLSMQRLLAMLERDLQDAGIGAEGCDLSAARQPKRRGPIAVEQKSGEKRKRSRKGRKTS
jgi:hypothetical protein